MFEIIDSLKVKLIFSEFPGLKTSSVGVFVNTGARHEDARVKGIAHFLEHMVFKGSKKYSYKKIKEEIEGRGGILNGFTSQEITGYYSHCLSYNIPHVLDILLDMVLFPLLDSKEIDKERKVILEEIKMHNDLPHVRANSLLDSLLWPNHPLGREVIGYFETVKNIERSNLRFFKDKFYSPSNIVIVCVSSCKKDKIYRIIREKTKDVPVSLVKVSKKHPPSLSKVNVVMEEKDIDQSHLCVGFRSFSARSKERFITEIIHIILGANMSSRLFEEIREKRGLCYDISTEVRRFKDSGSFSIHVGLDSRNIITVLSNIFKQLRLIKKKEISKKELERAKEYFLGQMLMSVERTSGRMFYLADSYLSTGKIYSVEKIKNIVDKIDTFSIRETAKKIFSFDRMCVSCVLRHKEKFEPALKKFIHNLL